VEVEVHNAHQFLESSCENISPSVCNTHKQILSRKDVLGAKAPALKRPSSFEGFLPPGKDKVWVCEIFHHRIPMF
jgi:hypothetical protein